jgi:hypothetical protein
MDQNTQEQLNLSLADITLALQIIQVASARGAFKPEEYTEIGGCYDRIFKFLEASGAIKRTDVAPAEPEAQDVPTPAAKKAAAKSKGKK